MQWVVVARTGDQGGTRTGDHQFTDQIDQFVEFVGVDPDVATIFAFALGGLVAGKLFFTGGVGRHAWHGALIFQQLAHGNHIGALRLRMIPIGDTFNRFRRVVRDVSQELGKDIDLIISGAETELDKTVVEKIGDPLMHLLRNAMDHGIESAEARLAAGKPLKGHLHLNAYHDSGSIVLEIADDGAGLNRDRILEKAQERGLIAPGATLTDQEIYNLIFEPGFSTAQAVTNLSGRGVGMDVVKRNITLLRGTVDLDSKPGQGTVIRIRLPLTLAIINGFLVSIGQSTYVIPLDMVQECIELSEGDRQISREQG